MIRNNTKLSALLENKNFVVEMMSKETPEDVQKFFLDHGVEMTIDEINEIGKALADIENGTATDELSEDSLENVAGGIGPLTAGAIAWGVVRVVGATGGLALAAYKWYKSR